MVWILGFLIFMVGDLLLASLVGLLLRRGRLLEATPLAPAERKLTLA